MSKPKGFIAAAGWQDFMVLPLLQKPGLTSRVTELATGILLAA